MQYLDSISKTTEWSLFVSKANHSISLCVCIYINVCKHVNIYSILTCFYGIYTLYSEKAMATHCSTLAWKIPWTEEPGRLQSTGSQRVRHDWATSVSLFTFMHWRRKWQPTPVFFLKNPRDGGAWWAAICGVTQSRTWLKRLSSSLSIRCITVWFFCTLPFFSTFLGFLAMLIRVALIYSF